MQKLKASNKIKLFNSAKSIFILYSFKIKFFPKHRIWHVMQFRYENAVVLKEKTKRRKQKVSPYHVSAHRPRKRDPITRGKRNQAARVRVGAMAFTMLHMSPCLQRLDRLEIIQTRYEINGHGTFTQLPINTRGIRIRVDHHSSGSDAVVLPRRRRRRWKRGLKS